MTRSAGTNIRWTRTPVQINYAIIEVDIRPFQYAGFINTETGIDQPCSVISAIASRLKTSV